MSLRIIHHANPTAGDTVFSFEADRTVRVGRGEGSDVVTGREPVDGLWTVSKAHVELSWDGVRWSARNVSDKARLFSAYEPGYEETPVEPGRRWSPVGGRWSLRLGRPDHPFHLLCSTDDHDGGDGPAAHDRRATDDDDPTAMLETPVPLRITALETRVLSAYYGCFVALPRPASLEPCAHHEAARRLGCSADSARKAIGRVNAKIAGRAGAPSTAAGRNVSSDIGRWLARAGLIVP